MLITDQVATAPCTDPVQQSFLTFQAKLFNVTLHKKSRTPSSLCNLCVLCVFVVEQFRAKHTTETQRTRRLHREIHDLCASIQCNAAEILSTDSAAALCFTSTDLTGEVRKTCSVTHISKRPPMQMAPPLKPDPENADPFTRPSMGSRR